MKSVNKITNTLKTYFIMNKLPFKISPLYYCFYWIIQLFIALIPVINVWIWMKIIDSLINVYNSGLTPKSLWIYILVYIINETLLSQLNGVATVVHSILDDKTSNYIDIQIMEKTAALDSSVFDNPKFATDKAIAENTGGYISRYIYSNVNTLCKMIKFLSSIGVFLSYNPILGIIYLLTYVPGSYISYINSRKLDIYSIYSVPETHKKDYYHFLLTAKHYAKDLRLYNLAEHFKDKYNTLWQSIHCQREKIFTNGIIMSILASLISYGGLAYITIYTILNVLNGKMDPGQVTLYLGLAVSSASVLSEIIHCYSFDFKIGIPRISKYMAFLSCESKIVNNGTKIVSNYPEIKFENVYFKYPLSDNYVLNNVTFTIKPKEKIALVGINGAGKSTIIKLLLRLYDLDKGRILIDGFDIKEYSLESLRSIFGVCSQYVPNYALSFGENIALSNVKNIHNEEEIKKAAIMSGAYEIIKDSEKEFNTPLTRYFEQDGLELSGGQWQKLAISRAFFRDSSMIILDEPSSALDPEAEDYIFKSFRKLCSNKGGILISHRLSSSIIVDRILVIENGYVIEEGTHSELINKRGRYAYLYELQASKYNVTMEEVASNE